MHVFFQNASFHLAISYLVQNDDKFGMYIATVSTGQFFTTCSDIENIYVNVKRSTSTELYYRIHLIILMTIIIPSLLKAYRNF